MSSGGRLGDGLGINKNEGVGILLPPPSKEYPPGCKYLRPGGFFMLSW